LTPQVQQWKDQELTGTMVGHLPPAIGLKDRNVASTQDVSGVSGQSKGDDGIALNEPQLVWRVGISGQGEREHLLRDMRI
jgi:hypothetical protein